MGFRMSARTLGVGIMLACMTVVAGAAPSSAHVIATCTATTATFVQAVGSPSAPVLVPMNLPATVCTLPTNVQVVAPAFQIVGFQAAPVIIPRVVSCTSSSTRVVSVRPITAPVVQTGQAAGTAAPVVVATLSGTAVTPLIVCF